MNSSLDSVKDVLEYERYAAVHDVDMTLAYAKKLEAFLDSKGWFHSLLAGAYSSVDQLEYFRLHGSLDCMRQLWRYFEHQPLLCILLQLWLHGLRQHWLCAISHGPSSSHTINSLLTIFCMVFHQAKSAPDT